MSGRGRRAFGLLGVIIALVLLSFALIPLMVLFQESRLGAEKSINYLIASNLITSQLEALRTRPFSDVEAYILGQAGTNAPRSVDILNGPFETNPETPDIIEKGVYKSGEAVFDRYTFIAYFPRPNPDPGRPDTYLMRQRIRIRVDVLWQEPAPGGAPAREARLSAATMVQNENFNPQPQNAGFPFGGGTTP